MKTTPDDPKRQTEELVRKDLEFRVLQRVSSEINSTLDLEEIYRISLATMDELFDFHHSVIFLLDDDSKTLTAVASRGYEGQAIGGQTQLGVGVVGMVAKKRRPLHMNNLGSQRSYLSAQRRRMVEAGRSEEIRASNPAPGLPDVECQIAIPLMVRETLIGVFSIESDRPRKFSEHDESLVTIVANQAASAIHTARLNQKLQRTNEELEGRVRARTAELEHELQVAQELLRDAQSRVEGPLLGESRAVRELREAISKHATGEGPLLVEGPPGSGKEAVARAIHERSVRRKGAFIHVRCAQLQGSEHASLLGPGSATGTSGVGRGKFDLAHGGTLYLEGVDALPRDQQTTLVDVLDRIETARREGRRASPDVRTILGTSRDLSQEVQASRFDLELYRRVNGERLSVPALCERPEDIPVLVEHFVRKYSRQFGKTVERVSEDSLKRLRAYRWPGNLRELSNVLERVIIVATGLVVEIEEETLEERVSLGGYRLVEKIGSGGMGEVWLGRHDLLARPAAVKLIRADEVGGATEGKRGRFRREARATANLRSPHTVQLYDFGVSETGTFYYVMELLYGMDLDRMVSRFGPLPANRIVMLLEQACRSLTEAHEHGLVHRDIKPANLFITALGPEYDFLKILDFGMVKATEEDESVQLTMEGVVQGTPAFMAPELALGEGEIDGRADLYSLGCVAYWMLTGMLVFTARSATHMLMQHVQDVPRPPSEIAEVKVPRALEAIVMRCLEKSPDDRPVSASELADALREVDCPEPWSQPDAKRWWMRHAPDALGSRQSD